MNPSESKFSLLSLLSQELNPGKCPGSNLYVTEVKESLFPCLISTQPPSKSGSCLGAITKQTTEAERPGPKCVLLVWICPGRMNPSRTSRCPSAELSVDFLWRRSPVLPEAWLCFSPAVGKSTPRSEEHSWGLDQAQHSGGSWVSNCPYISNAQHGLYTACKAFTITLGLPSPKLYICHSSTFIYKCLPLSWLQPSLEGKAFSCRCPTSALSF